MTSQQSLLSTIDHLLLHIHHVKIFQQHWTLIHTYLTSLRIQLNHTHTFQHTTHTQLYHDIHQTLSLIQQLLTNSTENQTTHNGMTYRDIESFLLRLHIRLAQHQADLTDDYEMKLHVLTNAYHQQQTLIKKVFDETIKQRLQTLEQNTKQNTLQQLHLLHQKYCHIIKAYLHGCIQLHKSVPLSGINSDTVSKVAHTFYDISAEDDIKLKHQWQSCDLPLTRSFIQFKHDKSTSFERNQSKQLLLQTENDVLRGRHSGKELSKGIWQQLVTAPYMMSMIERDKYQAEEEDNDISEENIIKTKRWIVILGDPGCGKTSFTRWLTHHLAQTLLLNNQHSTDYGPLRIPILIRIGEYADTLKQHPSLSLFDYIGKHQWMGKHILADDASISMDELSCALQDYIRHGQALVILDGLDEIPASDLRSRILHLVEQFVDTYIQTSQHISVFDNNPQLNQLFDDPSRSGGNQIIVTSRIVGYHLAPLVGHFTHYTIRPMDIEHMKDFVDYWFFRVHQHILDILHLSSSSSLTNQSETHAHALKEELEKSENSGLLDVASNACLMSFVCSVAFSQTQQHQSPLPSQRILLYESIVQSMLSLWTKKRSSISLCDLIHILSDIGTYIHGHSSSGLIHEHQMKQICIQSIKNSSGKSVLTNEELVEIEEQACEFVRIIREDVGILAARGESLYGFLHLTFQEYFTCLKLIDVDGLDEKITPCEFPVNKKLQNIVQSLRQYSNDPRFRVPIALALGKISLDWSQEDFDDFCIEFIRQEDSSSELLPIGAYMLISYGNDFVKYPSHNVLFKALDCLIIAAGEHKWSAVCPFLYNDITDALDKFPVDDVSLWVHSFLSQSPPHNIQTISALCSLIEGKPHQFDNIKWLNKSSCSILQYLSAALDGEHNGFAIDRLLVKVVFSNHRLLPIKPNTLKDFLITEEIEIDSIPSVLFPLIIALYGGLKRDDKNVIFNPFYIYRDSTLLTPILVRVLSQKNSNTKDRTLLLIKEECLKLLLSQTQNQDESSETVDLCIATICLYGIDYVKENMKIISNSLLQLSFDHLKYISMILRQYYFADTEDNILERKITKFLSNILQKLSFNKSSKEQYLDLLDSLRSGSARLCSSSKSILLQGIASPNQRVTTYLPNSLRKEDYFLDHLLSTDLQLYSDRKSCSLLYHFTKLFWIFEQNELYDTQYRMAVAMDTSPAYLLFRNDEDPLFVLTFIPSHLRNLYRQLFEQRSIIMNSKDIANDDNDKQYLYFGHILTECLMFISNSSCKRLSLICSLLGLLPCLRMYQLENFGSSLLWMLAIKDSNYLKDYETTKQRPMNYETGLYIDKIENLPVAFDMEYHERVALIKTAIADEEQRLQNALNGISQWSNTTNRLSLLLQCVQGAMSIHNNLMRLDALSMIAFYSHSDYQQIQINNGKSLQTEIEDQFINIYSDLPLLLHTTMLIRCLPLLQHQLIVDNCLENLLNKFLTATFEDQNVVYKALSPYLQSHVIHLSFLDSLSNKLHYDTKRTYDRSSILMEYMNNKIDEDLSSLLVIPTIYLSELVGDFYHLLLSDYSLHIIDESIVNKLFQWESSILSFTQLSMISNIIRIISSSNQKDHSKKTYKALNNALHRFDMVEFKACRSLECWMKWKDSNELSIFAYHAALLLANSDLWSVDVAIIISNLLCDGDDRFCQRAEMILRKKSDENDLRTSSKLGLDVLLTFQTKKAHFHYTSPFAKLTLCRLFDNVTIDLQSHFDAFLWLERYRIHTLIDEDYSLDKLKKSSISYLLPYFPTGVTKNVLFCDNLNRISDDLIEYMCDLIKSNFMSFVEIDGNSTSAIVVKSHVQFVVSIIVSKVALTIYSHDFGRKIMEAVMVLIETSINNEIRQAAANALGYICNRYTYNTFFEKLQIETSRSLNETNSHSIDFLCSLISSYCHCISINRIDCDDDTIEVFSKLLKHSSTKVVQAAQIGLGRILDDTSKLLEMLDSDYIQCYHALVGSTAYVFLYAVQESRQNATVDFIEQHPDLLPIFIVELYNSIRHFTDNIHHIETVAYYLTYGYPLYVVIASLVAVRMPATFCAFIRDWTDGENLKQALFYTSKQHDFPQRAACITILSIFGELTVELCQMIIEGLRDDPHIQNTCYKCLTRINSIKDEKAVLDLLFSYLKSKSMNVRYVAVKILLHLSKSSRIPLNQVQRLLDDLMLDPDSNEDLRLIKEQYNFITESVYYYVGSLKDVIYSLVGQYLTNNSNDISRTNILNDIDMNFVESQKASRLAACRYEPKLGVNLCIDIPTTTKVID